MIAVKSDLPTQLVGSCGIRYDELFRDAGDAMLLVDSVVLDCNQVALKLFRATLDQIAGRPLEDLYPQQQTKGYDASTGREYSRRANQGEIQRYDWNFLRPDGTSFKAGVTLSRVGEIGSGYHLAILRPLPHIDETEVLLRERTAQLESVNAELDAFSYSVSHDLRAAILGIAACSQIVVKDFGASLSEEAKGWLVHIHEDSVQLDKFTEALVELSRVSRKPLYPSDLDLTSMAREIVGNLAHAGSDKTVEFQVYNGLTAQGDSALVRTLLQHLLENAWKFTGKTAGARIEVGCLQSDSSNHFNKTFYVRDNGAGFDMAQADRLFVAFQRLHSDPEFAGNGLGLAMVRRIAHRHGGKVWGEGAPGAGATFFFTLGDSHPGDSHRAIHTGQFTQGNPSINERTANPDR